MARLDAHAASIAPATKLFLGRAGITAGMRVLDLGTGLGHVAFMLSKVSGPPVRSWETISPRLCLKSPNNAGRPPQLRFIEADVQGFRDARTSTPSLVGSFCSTFRILSRRSATMWPGSPTTA